MYDVAQEIVKHVILLNDKAQENAMFQYTLQINQIGRDRSILTAGLFLYYDKLHCLQLSSHLDGICC